MTMSLRLLRVAKPDGCQSAVQFLATLVFVFFDFTQA
jgi:hypothetical protein